MNSKQKPNDANLSDDVVVGGPAPNLDGAEGAPPIEAHNDTTHADAEQGEAPAWAAPLRDMYQQVVEEPLPDFLSDLLSRLDRDAE